MHRLRIATLISAALLGATGCATPNNTGKGAAIGGGTGALVGAGIGGIAGGGKGALLGGLIGAAVGAGTGAAIGHSMDEQQRALAEVESATVTRQGDDLVVRFRSAVLFATNEAELTQRAKLDLADLAQVLKTYPDTEITVEGHTDSTGRREVNERLSWARAAAVVAFLASQGVAPERMTSRGYADTRPVADNTTPDGRSMNRRVEVRIAPRASQSGLNPS